MDNSGEALGSAFVIEVAVLEGTGVTVTASDCVDVTKTTAAGILNPRCINGHPITANAVRMTARRIMKPPGLKINRALWF
jgi:hypothetical protein